MESFFVFRRIFYAAGSFSERDIVRHGMIDRPETVFPQNETPKEPVRSRYEYPDASNKYILETLYLREKVNNRDEILGRKQQ